MPAYKITRVSQDPPREWNNPKGGIIYYKKVMLEGHERPVSVGKKSPDALKVGDTIYGTIEKTALPEDKWHAEQNPNFGGGSTGGQGSGGRSHERVFKADPDRQADIKSEWAIGKVVEIIGIDDLTKVEGVARQLFQMVDRVKGSATHQTTPATHDYPPVDLTPEGMPLDIPAEEMPW